MQGIFANKPPKLNQLLVKPNLTGSICYSQVEIISQSAWKGMKSWVLERGAKYTDEASLCQSMSEYTLKWSNPKGKTEKYQGAQKKGYTQRVYHILMSCIVEILNKDSPSSWYSASLRLSLGDLTPFALKMVSQGPWHEEVPDFWMVVHVMMVLLGPSSLRASVTVYQHTPYSWDQTRPILERHLALQRYSIGSSKPLGKLRRSTLICILPLQGNEKLYKRRPSVLLSQHHPFTSR